jgi:hypothetical protein
MLQIVLRQSPEAAKYGDLGFTVADSPASFGPDGYLAVSTTLIGTPSLWRRPGRPRRPSPPVPPA